MSVLCLYICDLILITRIIGITGESSKVYVALPTRLYSAGAIFLKLERRSNFRWLLRELTENKARSDFEKTNVQVS